MGDDSVTLGPACDWGHTGPSTVRPSTGHTSPHRDMAFFLLAVCGWFCSTKTELDICSRDIVACKAWNIYYPASSRKGVLASALQHGGWASDMTGDLWLWGTIRHTLVSEPPRTSLPCHNRTAGEWQNGGSGPCPCDLKSANQMDMNSISAGKDWVQMVAANPSLHPRASSWKDWQGCHSLWRNPLCIFPASQPMKPLWGRLWKTNIFNDFTRWPRWWAIVEISFLSSRFTLQYLPSDNRSSSLQWAQC